MINNRKLIFFPTVSRSPASPGPPGAPVATIVVVNRCVYVLDTNLSHQINIASIISASFNQFGNKLESLHQIIPPYKCYGDYMYSGNNEESTKLIELTTSIFRRRTVVLRFDYT